MMNQPKHCIGAWNLDHKPIRAQDVATVLGADVDVRPVGVDRGPAA